MNGTIVIVEANEILGSHSTRDVRFFINNAKLKNFKSQQQSRAQQLVGTYLITIIDFTSFNNLSVSDLMEMPLVDFVAFFKAQ